MKLPQDTLLRLQFLCRVVERERRHLLQTTRRLFTSKFNLEQVANLEAHPDIAERVEAVVGRFGRLQDTLGDKLLPAVLGALGERVASAADNLDRAERLNFVRSADEWFQIRSLRNQMVHEYVEDPVVLHGALMAGRDFVGSLEHVTEALLAEATRRGWR